MMKVCNGCGQLHGIKEYDAALWDVYYRIDDGRSSREALVYTSADFDDPYDEDEIEATKLAMERDMHGRGLCTECGRPDLTGVDPERILSEEDAKEMQEMWAMEQAEIRAGC